jgi:diguanylate cyclase (GGDEF)-like protein/PAS domain S-box-containing protein
MPVSRAAIAQNTDSRAAGLAVAFGLADPGLLTSAVWVVDAVRAIARAWPLVIIAKIAGVLLMLEPWSSSLAALPGGAALALITAGLAIDLLMATVLTHTPLRQAEPHRQMAITLGLALLSGGSFSLALLATGDAATGTHWPLYACMPALVAVTIFGSARLLSVAYCVGAGLPTLLAHSDLRHVALLGFALAAMALVAQRRARAEHARHEESHAAELRGRRAEGLLSEHERTGRGWFWETDRNGRITYLSEALAEIMGVSGETLVGRPITGLFAQGERHRSGGERTLGFHLSARSAFSDVSVRVAVSDGERVCAISGQPIVNEFGQFFGFRGSGTDLTALDKSEQEVIRLAEFDSLTGLPNRFQMMRALDQAVLAGGGQPGESALMMLDLDRFKSVNDTLGHPAGDQLLRLVSERLQRVIGDKGLVGRLGGDEFKVVLPGRVGRPTLGAIAEAIITNLSQPYPIEGTQVVIGASVGIALCPDHGVTTDALIRNADLALYAAKGNGRGTYRFYSSEMHADAEDRRQLEEDLRGALAQDGLHLVYQPVVSAATEHVTGYEALLRWEHPVRGPISPTQFIPVAEDAGLISQIGEWVLRTACRDAGTWPEDIRVAVNVSPIQFANPTLPAIVVSALAAGGLAADRLELEITESVFLNDDADTDAMFARLKGIGVRLALDDFGTGYSSLGYLKKAPFDKIKIDQSFVRGAAIKGSRNSAIIKSIVSLAEALSMDTTAEGAETQDRKSTRLNSSHRYISRMPSSA